jgi:hypothetical protein
MDASASEPSAPPLRRASTHWVPKPSTRQLKEPSAPPTPENLSCLGFENLSSDNPLRNHHNLGPEAQHLKLRRAFDTSTPESLSTSSPQKRDLQDLELHEPSTPGAIRPLTPPLPKRPALRAPPKRDYPRVSPRNLWHQESTLGASSSESLSVFEFQRTIGI